jgi:hypothetical protein
MDCQAVDLGLATGNGGNMTDTVGATANAPALCRARWFGVAVTLGAFAALLLFITLRVGIDRPTRAAGDEADYDSLAWELSRGRGFGVDYLDPEFRRPYEAAAATDEIYRLRSERQGLMTYRPPLFPFAVASSNWLFGRQFWGMRVWNTAAMAVACGLTAIAAWRCGGVTAAGLVPILYVIIDARTRLYAQAFLTEAFAVVEVAVLCVLLAGNWPAHVRKTAAVGVLVGVMLLTRPMFLLWLPWIAGLIVVRVRASNGGTTVGRALAHVGLFATVVAVVLLPWGIRNCRVLGRWMPLGTQGAIELPAAWGETPWALWGEWRVVPDGDFAEPDPQSPRTLIERELRAADAGMRRARAWLAANPGRAVALVPIKILNEFAPNDWSQGLLLVLAIVGGVFGRRAAVDVASFDRYRAVGGSLVATQLLAVGLTWSVPESRFVVPLLFIEHLFAAMGLAAIVHAGSVRWFAPPVRP